VNISALSLKKDVFFYPYIGYHNFDARRPYSDKIEIGLRAELPLKLFKLDNLFLEPGAGFVRPKNRLLYKKENMITYGLNFIYYLHENDYFTPFVILGAGGDYLPNNLKIAHSYGLGIKLDWIKDVPIKIDSRYVQRWSGVKDFISTFSFGYNFDINANPKNKKDKFNEEISSVKKGEKIQKFIPEFNKIEYDITTNKFKVFNLEILFDTDKDEIKPEYYPNIAELADFINFCDKTVVFEIQGHTDNQGAADYNLKLSQRRAENAKKILVDIYGIPENRIIAKGYGQEKPIVSNDTPEGRAKNRRITVVQISQ